MTSTKPLLALLAAIVFSSGAEAQTDFFMSLNPLNTGAINSDLLAEVSPGDSASIYIYYTTNGPADSDIDAGIFLDAMASDSGVIEFVAAETLDFDILLFGSPVGMRWEDFTGPASEVTPTFVNELAAFRIFSGIGIAEANNGAAGTLDSGYDFAADAFLFGKIDFVVPNDAEIGSSIDVLLTPGNGGILNAGETVEATFGAATFTVVSSLVLGDLSGDGLVSMADVPPFVDLITSRTFQEEGDINGDGAVNLFDIRPFVDLLMP